MCARARSRRADIHLISGRDLTNLSVNLFLNVFMFRYKCYKRNRVHNAQAQRAFVAIAQVCFRSKLFRPRKSQFILFAQTIASRDSLAQPISSGSARELFWNGKRSKIGLAIYAFRHCFPTNERKSRNIVDAHLAHMSSHFFFPFYLLTQKTNYFNLFESLLRLKLFAHMRTKEEMVRAEEVEKQSAVVVEQHERTSAVSILMTA